MIHLEISEHERQVLCDVLKTQLSDLSYEIANTDNKGFRDQLKARRDALQNILAAAEKAPAS